MTLKHVNDLKVPIGEVIDAAGGDGVLIERKGKLPYAAVPLDDEMLDYLLERNPAFIHECAKIRAQMKKGEFKTHDDVKRALKK